jgi:hypothetical protein
MKKAEEESKKREREQRGFLKRQREQVDFELQYLQDQQQQQNVQNKKHAAERQKMNDKYAALAEVQRTGAIIFAQQQQASRRRRQRRASKGGPRGSRKGGSGWQLRGVFSCTPGGGSWWVGGAWGWADARAESRERQSKQGGGGRFEDWDPCGGPEPRDGPGCATHADGTADE